MKKVATLEGTRWHGPVADLGGNSEKILKILLRFVVNRRFENVKYAPWIS